MKRKIKLRDMTWDECCAIGKECEKEGRALSYHGVTFSPEEAYRLKILLPKEMMDEEVEIEVPDILTPEERDYLKKVLAPYYLFLPNIRIQKWNSGQPNEAIEAVQKNDTGRCGVLLLSLMVTSAMPFKGITQDDSFTLEELGL